MRNLPINYRRWFIDKVISDHKKKQEDDTDTPLSEQRLGKENSQNIAMENIFIADRAEKSFK